MTRPRWLARTTATAMALCIAAACCAACRAAIKAPGERVSSPLLWATPVVLVLLLGVWAAMARRAGQRSPRAAAALWAAMASTAPLVGAASWLELRHATALAPLGDAQALELFLEQISWPTTPEGGPALLAIPPSLAFGLAAVASHRVRAHSPRADAAWSAAAALAIALAALAVGVGAVAALRYPSPDRYVAEIGEAAVIGPISDPGALPPATPVERVTVSAAPLVPEPRQVCRSAGDCWLLYPDFSMDRRLMVLGERSGDLDARLAATWDAEGSLDVRWEALRVVETEVGPFTVRRLCRTPTVCWFEHSLTRSRPEVLSVDWLPTCTRSGLNGVSASTELLLRHDPVAGIGVAEIDGVVCGVLRESPSEGDGVQHCFESTRPAAYERCPGCGTGLYLARRALERRVQLPLAEIDRPLAPPRSWIGLAALGAVAAVVALRRQRERVLFTAPGSWREARHLGRGRVEIEPAPAAAFGDGAPPFDVPELVDTPPGPVVLLPTGDAPPSPFRAGANHVRAVVQLGSASDLAAAIRAPAVARCAMAIAVVAMTSAPLLGALLRQPWPW